MKQPRTLALVQTGLLAAVLAVLSQLVLPLPGSVPLTLQTFGVSLCAYLGGLRRGLPAVLVYLGLGAAGVPVFAGFRGGIGVLGGLTGGFLWGFILLALLCGIGAHTGGRLPGLLLGLFGLVLCHACGLVQYAAVTGLGLPESLWLVSVPCFWKDVLSLAAALAAAGMLRRALRRAGVGEW